MHDGLHPRIEKFVTRSVSDSFFVDVVMDARFSGASNREWWEVAFVDGGFCMSCNCLPPKRGFKMFVF